MLSNGLTLFAAGLAAAAGVSAYSPPRAVYSELSKRADGDVQLHKRFSGTRWTFFDVGLGACGKYNVESDFIVALNAEQFGSGYPGPHCEETITMTYNGKTATAKIMDRCPGCPYGGLDLSRSLFRYFAPESAGVIQGDWNFGGSSGGSPPPPAAPPAPQTTSTKTKEAVVTPVSKPTTTSIKAPAPVTTTRAVTSAPAPARITTTTRAAQATPSTHTPPARVAASPSPSPAPPRASPSTSSSTNKPKTTKAAPQFAAANTHFASASASSSSVTSSSSTASAATKSATTSSKASSTVSISSSSVIPSASASSASASTAPSATPTDTEALIQSNIEAITAIISRLADLLQKLRLSKSTN